MRRQRLGCIYGDRCAFVTRQPHCTSVPTLTCFRLQLTMASALIGRLKHITTRHVAAAPGCLRPSVGHDHPDRSRNTPSPEGTTPAAAAPDEASESFKVDLPVELWLAILGHITDKATLAVLTQVSRTFCHEAEVRLYHTVAFDFDPVIYRFCESITATPRRATLVAGFHLMAIENAYGSTLAVLFPVLQSLLNLEYLTLNISLGSGLDAYEEQRKLKAILSLRFPLLRGFATHGALAAHPQSLRFVQEHPLLEELQFDGSYSEAWVQGISSAHLASLRALACRAWFLHDDCPVLTTLTHFHATSLYPGGLARIAGLLGKHLVSLRVSHCVPFVSQPSEPMALNEIASEFPRLRFLQLDMEHRVKPYVSKQPVGFIAGARSKSENAALGRAPRARFTLALVYSRPQAHAVDMNVAAAWHEFLNRTALRVLRDWDDCVERIVYRHTIIPYVSVALSGGDGTRLVRKQDKEMRDDEWKFV
ncbi:hypothetical protein LXA43DRAFT_1131835 [Ganoderma leucocontextum]|nr:hypothetical protein LXA43DRAFT_1131835 [Ganoderma leucocontextum]